MATVFSEYCPVFTLQILALKKVSGTHLESKAEPNSSDWVKFDTIK